MEDIMIAPCGMNCSLCISYQAMKYDLNKQGFNRQYCPGCNPRGENCIHMKDSCTLLGEGQIGYCYQCVHFPCKRLKSLDRRYRTKYHMSMIENLSHILRLGMASFLKAEKNKWLCVKCREPICCHNGLCLHCDLDILQKNRKYRWGI